MTSRKRRRIARHTLSGGIVLALLISACGRAPAPAPDAALTGQASYYAQKFHGRRTANGEIYDQTALTAAHRTLPFGTRVRVTRIATGKSVIVRINDRGPWKDGRVIDLSRAAADSLDMLRDGLARVRLDPF